MFDAAKKMCVVLTTEVSVGLIIYHEKDHIINKKCDT